MTFVISIFMPPIAIVEAALIRNQSTFILNANYFIAQI